MREFDVQFGDGTLHAYDTLDADAPDGGDAGDRLAVLWHHGTPNLGTPPRPLLAAADRLGLRWVSYDRPGYGGSTPAPGRDLAAAAPYATAVADALGIDGFAVVGHSGGGCHALACAALLPDRVVAVVSGAALAPFGADGLDWFAGMAPSGMASLRAAAEGRDAKELHQATAAEYDPEFTSRDLDALSGDWAWFGEVVGPAVTAGAGGLVDDDLAYVSPWGCDPTQVPAPTLILHGGRDRVVPPAHGEWLAAHIRSAELRLAPDDGHISVLTMAPDALAWLRSQAPG